MTEADRALQVLSLGAGVQSTTVLLMSLDGELPPLDHAIFADTQREPASVYKHLAWLVERCESAGLPLHVVTYGDLAEYALDPAKRSGTIPVFIRNAKGEQGKMRRDCTADFKVAVIQRKVRELLAPGQRCDQWMGISWDEWQRMRDSKIKNVANVYPLVDRHLTRYDCLQWLADHGYSAPRSACYFCPFHSDREWRRLRDEEPEEWERAIEFERELQRVHATSTHKARFRGVPFLHRSMVPLSEVDLRTPEDKGQGNLFDEECAGVCGV